MSICRKAPKAPAEILLEEAEKGRISVCEPLTQAYLDDAAYVTDDAMYTAAAAEADTAVVLLRAYQFLFDMFRQNVENLCAKCQNT